MIVGCLESSKVKLHWRAVVVLNQSALDCM